MKRKPWLEYNTYSGTIRQMPQNYCMAFQMNASTPYSYWVCAADIAADVSLATKIFQALFDFETRWGSAKNLIKKVGQA